ncbi:MAG TPA: aldehyde dehydrogenase family protein [Candidatus Binataceae bacterium]|nr:aldehyde dehydrogenase family protein [Candidatus Binataceae bacterium]
MAAALPALERAAQGAKVGAVLDFLRRSPTKLLIDGKWTAAKSGKTFETINPANEEVLALVAEGDKADVDEAVVAARRAFEEGRWRTITPHQRGRYLLRIAELIDKYADELAELESLDNGKPVAQARTIDIAGAAGIFRYFAGWPSKIYGETNPSDPGMFNYTLREPIGVCGLIIPWNFPLMMAVTKIAPALACGNTMILKPAEQTPLTAIRLGELLQEAGIPDGVVNIITGFGPGAGSAIAEHPGIDKVAFTGSTEVGKLILQASAGNLKRVSLELGGKSPNIVFPDADLASAVKNAMTGVFYNSGQVCAAGTRIFVQRDIYDNFVADLTAASERMTPGNPLDPQTRLGPVVSREQFDRVLGYVTAGRHEGARVTIGGEAVGGKGYYVKPTIFADVRNDMKIAQEEIFGPVAAAIPFKDEDDAVLQGNATTYGLAAAVWSRDIRRAHRVARALKAGTVWVNCYGVTDTAMPFGGYKQSGFGREGSRHVIDLFTQIKSVYVKL